MKINTIKLLDKYLGGLICFFIPPSIRSKPKKENKILIIQLWSIGETILTLPAIKAIKEKYGCVDVLCTSNNIEIFNKVNFIDNLIVLDDFIKDIPKFILRYFKCYDIVFDFEEYLNVSAILSYFVGKFRVGFITDIRKGRDNIYNKKVRYNDCQHVVQTFCDQIPVEAPKELIPLKGEPSTFLEEHNIKSFIGLCVTSSGTSANNRRWPYFKQLIKQIKEDIIIFASPNEDVTSFLIQERVFVCARTIGEMITVLKKCKIFISNDTGPMHIAAAQGVKTIGLFGPNISIRFGPYGKNNTALSHHLPCSPCINVHKAEIPDCKDAKCMKLINVEEVLKVIQSLDD